MAEVRLLREARTHGRRTVRHLPRSDVSQAPDLERRDRHLDVHALLSSASESLTEDCRRTRRSREESVILRRPLT